MMWLICSLWYILTLEDERKMKEIFHLCLAAVRKWKVQQLLIIASFLKSFSCLEGQRVEFLVKIIACFKGFEKWLGCRLFSLLWVTGTKYNMLGKIKIDHSKITRGIVLFSHTLPCPRIKPPPPPPHLPLPHLPPSRCHSRLEKHTF